MNETKERCSLLIRQPCLVVLLLPAMLPGVIVTVKFSVREITNHSANVFLTLNLDV